MIEEVTGLPHFRESSKAYKRNAMMAAVHVSGEHFRFGGECYGNSHFIRRSIPKADLNLVVSRKKIPDLASTLNSGQHRGRNTAVCLAY
jgi:hypothetical protein